MRPPWPPATFDDPQRAARVRGLAPRLGAVVDQFRAKSPTSGIAVGLVVDEELVWSQGWGQRTAAGGTIDRDTAFRIGSITKVVTAMAILRLQQDGKLTLDDALASHLPEAGGLLYPTIDAGVVTIRQLLTHTAGLARQHAPPGSVALQEAELLERLDGLGLERSPGTESAYSNLGMGLLTLVIARASGQPYREYVHRAILAPLGMSGTAWDATGVSPERLATGHDKGGQPVDTSQHWRLGALEGAGGLYSTVTDLARLTAHQLAAWPARSSPEAPPLARALVRDSHRMQAFRAMRVRSSGSTARANGIGWAWQVEQSCLFDHLVWHNGGTEGYHSALFFLPQRGIGVIVLGSSRAQEVSTLARRLLRTAVNEAALPVRHRQPSPALSETMDQVARMFELGNLNETDYQRLFHDSFREAVPLQKMRNLLSSVRSKGGACRLDTFRTVHGPRQATATFECNQGVRVDVDVHLTDTPTPQLDLFAFRFAREEVASTRSSRCD
jgi:CubicO group peptidase (beta-lactamase class C family)